MKFREIKSQMSNSRFVTNSEVFYVRALIPFIAGIAVISTCPLPIGRLFFNLLIVSMVSLLIATNLLYGRFALYRYKGVISASASLLFFISGCVFTVNANKMLSTNHFSKSKFQYLRIAVTQEPQVRNSILMFKAKVLAGYTDNLETGASGNLLVSIKIDSSKTFLAKYGDEMIVLSRWKETVANPNPATFDYKKWLAVQHIDHQSFVHQNEIRTTGRNRGNSLMRFALETRAVQVEYFRKILRDDNVYAVASTLILGYRSDLDEEVLSYYSKTGTIHALSVSGMHVGLIYLVLSWIFSFLNRNTISRIIRSFIILLLIWIYTVITGLSPSVLRSAIMISVLIIGKTLNRSSSGYNILAFSAFIILCYDPYVLWDVGFQLSYLAVLGLIFLQPIIERWFFFKNIFLRKIWSALSISLAAQLFTFPLSIFYFHQFPSYFLFSNLFILLPVTAIMYLGILVLLGRFNFLAGPFEWLISFTNSGLKFIAELPFSTFSTIWVSKIELLLLTVSITGIMIGLHMYRKNLLIYSIVLFLVFQTVSAIDKVKGSSQRILVIYNIKNQYAVAFITGQTAIIFTKLKVEEKLFRQNVQPYLDQRGITKISCTTDFSSVECSYLKIDEDDILFHDYSISKEELQDFELGNQKALIRNID